MGTKMAVAFANIFVAKIERQILRQSSKKNTLTTRCPCGTPVWKKIEEFLRKANSFHPTLKFTAEISETEITFLDTKVYKGGTFHKKSILDMQIHYKGNI